MSLASQGRRLPLPPLNHQEGQESRTLDGVIVTFRVSNPLLILSSSLSGSNSPSQLFPEFRQGECVMRRGSFSHREGSIQASSPLSRLLQLPFCRVEGILLVETVVDLSHLNWFVFQTRFKMETSRSVLRAVWRGDWMVSIDLKDVYLQIPVHPDSCQFLRFVTFWQVFQFKALCFGLSQVPQLFTRVMAPMLVILHDLGARIL